MYSIPDSDQFIIDPATGVLSLKSTLEEGKDVFEITATVNDGAHQATVPVVVNILPKLRSLLLRFTSSRLTPTSYV